MFVFLAATAWAWVVSSYFGTGPDRLRFFNRGQGFADNIGRFLCGLSLVALSCCCPCAESRDTLVYKLLR